MRVRSSGWIDWPDFHGTQNKKGRDKTEPDTNPVRRRLKLIEVN